MENHFGVLLITLFIPLEDLPEMISVATNLVGQIFFLICIAFFFKVLTQDIKVLITKVADLQKDVTTLQVLQSKATDKNQLVEEKIEQLQRQLLKTEGQ